jgi:hypothetical protein
VNAPRRWIEPDRGAPPARPSPRPAVAPAEELLEHGAADAAPAPGASLVLCSWPHRKGGEVRVSLDAWSPPDDPAKVIRFLSFRRWVNGKPTTEGVTCSARELDRLLGALDRARRILAAAAQKGDGRHG